MYTRKIENYLRRSGIKVGDWVRIKRGKEIYEGILMPRIGLGDTSCLVIKLRNGYNVGVKFNSQVRIEFLKRGKGIKVNSGKFKQSFDLKKPTVAILGCGGTIASKVEYKTGAVYPAFTPSDLITAFPELKKFANLRARKLFDLFSEDMTPKHWQLIAKEAAKEIKGGVNGVVLMHGTDTMHYTSAALSFMLRNLPVPVILVGAQRSSDRGSSDNQVNLICSVLAACYSDLAEVCVCMHGSMSDDFCYLHQGTKVRKLHTSRRDAFKSVNTLPYAKVFYAEKRIEYLRTDYRKRDKRNKLKLDTKINPNVGLLYFHPGIKPQILNAFGKLYDGIVIAATGLGHVALNPLKRKYAISLLPAIKSLIQSGVPIVFAPQTIFGRLNMNVYSTGRILEEVGVIGNGCDWTPECALVKLMWVLGHTKDMRKIRELMTKNLAGEISERSFNF